MPRTSDLDQQCLSRDEFDALYFPAFLTGKEVAAEALFDMQADCLASQGIEVEAWLREGEPN